MHDLSVFVGQSCFANIGAQDYLIFQSIYYTLQKLAGTEKILSWKSKGLSSENIVTPNTAENSLSQQWNVMEIQTFI